MRFSHSSSRLYEVDEFGAVIIDEIEAGGGGEFQLIEKNSKVFHFIVKDGLM